MAVSDFVRSFWGKFFSRTQTGPDKRVTPLIQPLVPPTTPAVTPPSRGQGGFRAGRDINWTSHVHPYESYIIEYADRHGEYSQREISLARIGEYNGAEYLGVYERGTFKTLRRDHILKMTAVGVTAPPIFPAKLSYTMPLPAWHVTDAVFKVPQLVGNRRWTVDLNNYTCTCPEKRIRSKAGYFPGMLGNVCPHMARAILENLPSESAWPAELVTFLRDAKRVAIAAIL